LGGVAIEDGRVVIGGRARVPARRIRVADGDLPEVFPVHLAARRGGARRRIVTAVARRVSSIVLSCALFALFVGGIVLVLSGVAWGRVLALLAFGVAVVVAAWRRARGLGRRRRLVAARRQAGTSRKDVRTLTRRSHREGQARETPDGGTLLMWALLGLTSLWLLWIVLKLIF
jgi:hypothetical protein